jgi:hypothetical protein
MSEGMESTAPSVPAVDLVAAAFSRSTNWNDTTPTENNNSAPVADN